MVHILRHVEIQAAHLVHHLHKGLEAHLYVVVDGHAQGPGDLFFQKLHTALAVSGVDFGNAGPVPVHHSIPRDGHHADLLVGHIVLQEHDGIRVAVAVIHAHQKNIIGLLPPHRA